MSQGLLKKYFKGVVAKRLSAVEADTNRSNQHEFNGTNVLKKLLGNIERKKFDALFIWLDDEHEHRVGKGVLTWYDARRNHPTRSEYRLYFSKTVVSEMLSEQDPIFMATRPDGTFLVISTKAFSTIENQLIWIFGLESLLNAKKKSTETPFVEGHLSDHAENTDFITCYILEKLGIETEVQEPNHVDLMFSRFGREFPTTNIFSSFARETLQGINPVLDPDNALLAWINQEELLFKSFESHIVKGVLKKGFYDYPNEEADIEGFLKFSLSVQNRRKSRAGLALENHLAEIFSANKVSYARSVRTEGRRKPDFLFPGRIEYEDKNFPPNRLTMLGAKSTCKDRWRQILTEAKRIKVKHLLTLEPGISSHQTQEMQRESVKLVLPKELHKTFRSEQQPLLMSLSEFIAELLSKDPQWNLHPTP